MFQLLRKQRKVCRFGYRWFIFFIFLFAGCLFFNFYSIPTILNMPNAHTAAEDSRYMVSNEFLGAPNFRRNPTMCCRRRSWSKVHWKAQIWTSRATVDFQGLALARHRSVFPNCENFQVHTSITPQHFGALVWKIANKIWTAFKIQYWCCWSFLCLLFLFKALNMFFFNSPLLITRVQLGR